MSFLKEYKLENRGNGTHVLPHLSVWKVGEQGKVTREFCEAIGVTQVNFHDLRATFVVHMLARGVSLARVMSIGVTPSSNFTIEQILRVHQVTDF